MINNKIFSLYVEMKIDHKYHLRYHFRYITTYCHKTSNSFSSPETNVLKKRLK